MVFFRVNEEKFWKNTVNYYRYIYACKDNLLDNLTLEEYVCQDSITKFTDDK